MNAEILIEEINRTSLKEHLCSFALAKTDFILPALIEGGNPVYKIKGDTVLFGYTNPPVGVGYTKLSRDQALSWFNSLNESDTGEDTSEESDSGACEICEVTPYQWDKLVQIVNGEQTEVDEDVRWLAETGLVTIKLSGNPQATSLGRNWARLK